jgi:hypothetical protein
MPPFLFFRLRHDNLQIPRHGVPQREVSGKIQLISIYCPLIGGNNARRVAAIPVRAAGKYFPLW